MAKLSQIDRWLSDVHNTDTCAVCGCPLGFRSAGSFCSPKCNTLAENLRQHIRTSLLPYTNLDFRLSFLEGVYPTLSLPECLRKYYPGTNQRIYPLMPMELQSVTQAMSFLREGMVKELGFVVVKEVEFAENLWAQNFTQARRCFERGLTTRMFLQSGIFICPECGGKWFDGNLTRYGNAATCCEPVQMKLPF